MQTCSLPNRVFGNPAKAAREAIVVDEGISEENRDALIAVVTAKLSPTVGDYCIVIVLSIVTIGIYPIVCFIMYGNTGEINLGKSENETDEEQKSRTLESAGISPEFFANVRELDRKRSKMQSQALSVLRLLLSRINIRCNNFAPMKIGEITCDTLEEAILAVLTSRAAGEHFVETTYSIEIFSSLADLDRELKQKPFIDEEGKHLTKPGLPSSMQLELKEDACEKTSDGSARKPKNRADWERLLKFMQHYQGYVRGKKAATKVADNLRVVQEKGAEDFMRKRWEEEKNPKKREEMKELMENEQFPKSTAFMIPMMRNILREATEKMESALNQLTDLFEEVPASESV
ncbi:MAG: DUF4234 domain-containing protein [Puniceicoccales bacterium]|nr:DUF4234 domain-containing protein [Puniceicoccales bacterium]